MSSLPRTLSHQHRLSGLSHTNFASLLCRVEVQCGDPRVKAMVDGTVPCLSTGVELPLSVS